jgi:hypothetical protein
MRDRMSYHRRGRHASHTNGKKREGRKEFLSGIVDRPN